MAEILTNNRDRAEFKVRVYPGIIGEKINRKKRLLLDAQKLGKVPFTYLDKDQVPVVSNECKKGPFFLNGELVNPGSGLWCATKLDSNGNMIEWGYCINRNYEVKTKNEIVENIKYLQSINKGPNYIVGYLKTFIIDDELRMSILDDPDILELLRNKERFPDITKYNLGDQLKIKDKIYEVSENLELGRFWNPIDVVVKKRRVIRKEKPKAEETIYGTNRDQTLGKTIRAYQGIINEDINRSKRGTNRIEKSKECIYPFDYMNKDNKRVTAKSTCVNLDMTMDGVYIGPEGGKWCATEVDDTGLMREWGYCTESKPDSSQKKEESNIWDQLCTSIRYEQWSTISELAKKLLLEGYSEKSIFNTLIQTCNKKRIASHFEQLKRLVNIEYIKLYPWVLERSAKPNIDLLKMKDNLSEIIINKLEYLEKSIGLNFKNGLASNDKLWLLNYYYILERLVILSILSETGEFNLSMLEKVKSNKNIRELNSILLELEKRVKGTLKLFVEAINKNGNVAVNFNNRPSELNSSINDNILIVNYSAFFGAIQKDKRVLYYDKLDLKKDIAEQLMYYNKSFVEPQLAAEESQEKELILAEEQALERLEEAADKKEIRGQSEWSNSNKEYYSNYPELNDPQFFVKLQRKKEFKMNKMTSWSDKKIEDLCRIDTFELSVQQQWVANYFNPETPYRGLLLYWGTGVGKTCASISIAEKHLDFYKKYNKKILIILGTSTLENYKKELYNFKKERLEISKNLVPGTLQCTKDRYWMPIESNDPAYLKKRESKILKKIEQDYEFVTYGSLKGILTRLLLRRGIKLELDDEPKVLPKKVPTIDGEELQVGNIVYKAYRTLKGTLYWKKIESKKDEQKEERIRVAISEYFSNRLIIVDEIQNIRTAGEGGDQIAPQMLEKVIHYSDDIKLVMMSATPMFNNATEIVYILNLLLENDRRDKVKVGDLFDSKDNLINPKLLQEISRGYISYVRGANPISFPLKLLPNESKIAFIKKNNEVYYPSPSAKMNGSVLEDSEKIKYNPLVKCTMSEYQEEIFKRAVIGEANNEGNLADVTNETFDINGKMISNLVFPSKIPLAKTDITSLYGERGFDRCFSENKNKYEYIDDQALVQKVPFLDQSILETYSPKFKKILDNILNTKNGIIFVYSEYKKGGSLPLALMLEQNGFEQVIVEGKFGDIRVKNRLESKHKRPVIPQKWKYVLLDGDLDPKKRAQIVDKCNSEENKEGNLIKVIIGTRVTGEGVDFARIRQIHILNPWDNFSRIDQTVGRGIRNCSHKDLPLDDRNVTVFLYASHIKDNLIETTDEKIHRRAERKDIQMKDVEFVLRNNAVDCYSNYLANKYSIEEFGERVGDKNNTRDCGYKNCETIYQCQSIDKIKANSTTDMDTYNIEYHANRELQKYKNVIKEMFEISVIYKLKHIRSYLEKKIDKFEEPIFLVALDKLLLNKEKLHDKYKRIGRIVFRDGYYMFQPIELDKTKELPEYYRSTPLAYKPSTVEIKHKEGIISQSKISNWVKEIKKLIKDTDDEDELAYHLDRVKDEIMKVLILEWFIGEYDNSKVRNEDRQDKLRNYFSYKDIIIMDEDTDLPKAIHWSKQLSYEFDIDSMELKEYTDGEIFKKPMITYNFDEYPLDTHVIGRLERISEGKDDSPYKQMVFKIIDFSFVENKANLKLDGKACMSYNKSQMIKLLENLEIEPEKSDKRENQCNVIELILRKYNREEKNGFVWWIESNKFYQLEKLLK